ncbi:MAG: NfeD family protein, partial [Saprospiraceae bacterium]|nr:NfeD family protein [Saprospiraceae bacterium]
VTLAFFSGLAAMLVVAYMLYLFAKLGQSGSVDMDSVLFESGTVYLTIPGKRKGIGKINVKVGNSIKEVRAVTEGQAIQTGKKVRVIEVMKGNILLVEPGQELLLERENSSK